MLAGRGENRIGAFTRLARGTAFTAFASLAALVALPLPVAAAAAERPPDHDRRASTLVLCTQNLWNYGSAEDVKRLRRSSSQLATSREDLKEQERRLVERLRGCDVVAVQEVLGAGAPEARAALDRLAGLLDGPGRESSGRWSSFIGDSTDVIRNGFLVRSRVAGSGVSFDPGQAGRDLGPVAGCPRTTWDRAPATLRLRVADRTLVLLSVHLKSKADSGGRKDPEGEHHERRRVVQAAALASTVRHEMKADSRALLIVAGDMNNVPGSATRGVLDGGLDPAMLLRPRDCLGGQGQLLCELPRRPALLRDLAAEDPDLEGGGSYEFDGREEMIDGFFVSPEAERLARESSDEEGDWRITLEGRLRRGSDHRMLRLELRW
jgi:predicted extracellular nuclease